MQIQIELFPITYADHRLDREVYHFQATPGEFGEEMNELWRSFHEVTGPIEEFFPPETEADEMELSNAHVDKVDEFTETWVD
jgi:hypothetical protein